jgi:hypothetical protein
MPLTGSRWNSTRFCVIECNETEPLLVGGRFSPLKYPQEHS